MDLHAQHSALRAELLQAAAEVIDSGAFILGPKVEALEREVAKLVQVRHAVAVASGTDALILALRALSIGAGDEVITSAYSFFASAGSYLKLAAPAPRSLPCGSTHSSSPEEMWLFQRVWTANPSLRKLSRLKKVSM